MRAAIQGRPMPEPPPDALTETLSKDAASFVTLMLHKQLRGCVGNLVPRDPLYRSVMNNAVGAALRDTRFEPVREEECPQLEVHISLLSALVPLQFGSIPELLNQLTPDLDGVVVRHAGRTSTYLPQVWKSFPNKEEFLQSLCRKAGLSPTAWREPGAELLVYRVFGFGEPTAA